MINAKVLNSFWDGEALEMRDEGKTYPFSKDRFNELKDKGYLVEDKKKTTPDKDKEDENSKKADTTPNKD